MKNKTIKIRIEKCRHLNFENREDCEKMSEYVCQCCGAGSCQEHKQDKCPYGGMGYIEV